MFETARLKFLGFSITDLNVYEALRKIFEGNEVERSQPIFLPFPVITEQGLWAKVF